MADVGFFFTTVFLVSYGFVKTVLLDFSPPTAIFVFGFFRGVISAKNQLRNSVFRQYCLTKVEHESA